MSGGPQVTAHHVRLTMRPCTFGYAPLDFGHRLAAKSGLGEKTDGESASCGVKVANVRQDVLQTVVVGDAIPHRQFG